jgi:DNA-directed RNA polymerase subunit M/transcription elongation factor TFIIS
MPLPIKIILVGFAGFAGFVSWMLFFVKRKLRQQLDALSVWACPKCGMLYGLGPAERARREYQERCKETRFKYPNCRINFVRSWEVRCPKCDAKARFYYEKKSLLLNGS